MQPSSFRTEEADVRLRSPESVRMPHITTAPVRSVPYSRTLLRPSIRTNKITSALVWIIGVYTTWLFIGSVTGIVSVPNSWSAMVQMIVQRPELLVMALVLQGILTNIEKPFWSEKRNSISALAILIDTLVNAGGIWPYIQHIDKTPTWAMLVQALHLQDGLSTIPALIIALIIGYMLAAAPERIWRW